VDGVRAAPPLELLAKVRNAAVLLDKNANYHFWEIPIMEKLRPLATPVGVLRFGCRTSACAIASSNHRRLHEPLSRHRMVERTGERAFGALFIDR
jgi:hypothetical protein